MTTATNTTTVNVQQAQEAGDTLTTTMVNTSVSEALPQVARALVCQVDFGGGSDFAKTTVTGQAWVKSTSRILAACGGASDDHDAEDSLLEQLQVKASNFVAGVGFDVSAHAPDGTTGKYTVHVVGV